MDNPVFTPIEQRILAAECSKKGVASADLLRQFSMREIVRNATYGVVESLLSNNGKPEWLIPEEIVAKIEASA